MKRREQKEVNNEGGAGMGSAVLMIKDLYNNENNDMDIVTPEMLYNIFSLYGHVVKIKMFLKTQKRRDQPISILSSLVQMENHMQAVRAAQFLDRFQLFQHWSHVRVSDRQYTIDPDTKPHTNRRFRLLYCEAGTSGGGIVDCNLYHRTNPDFLNFKPTRIIRISNLPQNMTPDGIHRRMSERYGNVVSLSLQGTSCDILFCNISVATTALAFEHGANLEGCRLSAAFLPETCIPTPQKLQQQPEQKVDVNNEGVAGRSRAVLKIKILDNNVNNDMNIMTPETLFNIFSLYGHVVKTKIYLKKQERHENKLLNGLVQMENHMQAVRAAHFLYRFQLFQHWFEVMVLDRMYTIDPDRKFHRDRRFRLLYCEAGPSGGGGMVDYNLYHRKNADFLNFKPTRIIRISNLPQNMTPDGIRRRMSERYGNVEAVSLQGTSCDILFWNVSEATTALAFEHGEDMEGCRLSATFLPETSIPIPQNLQQQPEQKVEVNNEGGADRRSAVLKIKNLHNNVNSDMNIVTPEMLFNIFSLYGHVVKIKIYLKMQRREDQEISVMNGLVQMENHMQAGRAAHFLDRFQLFKQSSQVMVSNGKHTIDPDTRTHSDRRFCVLYCEAGPSGGGGGMVNSYNLYHRTNAEFLNFKPTRIIRITNLPENMTADGIRRRMKEHYGNVVGLKLQGTSCDILFWNVNEATTSLAFEHGASLEGNILSATFLPETCIPNPQKLEDKLTLLSWPASPSDE